MRRFLNLCIAGTLFLWVAGAAQGQVFLATYFDSTIHRYSSTGTELAPIPFANLNSAGAAAPAGVTFGPDGSLYVSSQTSVFATGAPDSILKVNPTTGAITPFINLATGYVPAGISFGPDGNLYVSRNGGQGAAAGSGSVDEYNGTTGAFIKTAVPNLSQPTNLVWSGNNLFISNFGAGTTPGSVVKFNGTSASPFVAAGAGGNGGSDPGLSQPAGLRVGPNGNLYVVDLLLGAVREYNGTTGAFITNLIPVGGKLNNQFPSDLVFDSSGHLLVADLGANRAPSPPLGNIEEFDAATGNFLSDFATGLYASQLAISAVPEPTSLALCGLAAVAFAGIARRRRKAKAGNETETPTTV